MKFIAAFAALAFAAMAQAQLTSCAGSTPTDMTGTSITLTPSTLCINQNVCATVSGTLINPIADSPTKKASLSIIGRYLGRVVYTDNHDLCTVLGASGYPCPVPVTTTLVTACVLVLPNAPANIPVALTIQAVNGNGNLIFCQSGTVTATTCT
ncbi:hypothetical protein B0O80DRAFT_423146 [Mortierella sp. GBAus27b]|nr:hypothetical protein BGX31_005199 [Mortierella sp. GBA43]KAI8360561.1 hypothetical protein B0O80DRAFT_423146 [Mortierella sp. GBAus27b]